MVAPLVAGAARVAGSTVARTKVTRMARAAATPQPRTAAGRRVRRVARPVSPQQVADMQANARDTLRMRNSRYGRMMKHLAQGDGEAEVMTQRANAFFATMFVATFFAPLLMLQLPLALFGASAAASESIPIVNYFVPGEEAAMLFLLLSGLLGLFLLCTAAIIFVARGVDCWSDWKFIIFALTFALCFIPVLGLIMVMVWCASVIYLQQPPEETEAA